MSPSGAATQSARTLVPGVGDLGPWYRAEVHGLPEAQLDCAAPAPAPEWLWWSIRRQASHRARVCFRWLFVLWGDRLWEGHPPPVHDLPGVLHMSPAGQPTSSQLNPATDRAIDGHRMPSDKRGSIGAEPHHRFCDFFWCTQASDRMTRNQFRFILRIEIR